MGVDLERGSLRGTAGWFLVTAGGLVRATAGGLEGRGWLGGPQVVCGDRVGLEVTVVVLRTAVACG